MSKPTAADVAKAAGVSKWTVIRAFTTGSSISERSREKILIEAAKLDYAPNLLARSLATNQTNLIAILVDDFANPHKLPALEALTKKLQLEGMASVLININDEFDHLAAMLNAAQRQVDAMVLVGTGFRPEMIQNRKTAAGAPPLFVFARQSKLDDIPYVDCDPISAMQAICEHLQQKGYRHPLYLSGPDVVSTGLGRYQFVQSYWASTSQTTVHRIQSTDYSVNSAKETIRQHLMILPRESWPDALICENDVLAIGAMDVLRDEFHLRVPEQMAVTGFDGTEIAALAAYDITSYAQPLEEMVVELVEMIKGRKPQQSVSLTGQLLPRQTT